MWEIFARLIEVKVYVPSMLSMGEEEDVIERCICQVEIRDAKEGGFIGRSTIAEDYIVAIPI